MKMLRLLGLVLLLSACAAPTPLPDFRYYAMPVPATVEPDATAVLKLPLVLSDLRASGVRGERPILYSSSLQSSRLLQYHYQLWTEPPTALILDSLLRTLNQAAIAPLVTDRLSAREPAVRLSGELTRFERMRKGAGWTAAIELRLRATLVNQSLPLLDKRYFAEIDAADELLETSVQAFRLALDQISAELVVDLRKLAPQVAQWQPGQR